LYYVILLLVKIHAHTTTVWESAGSIMQNLPQTT